MPELITQNLFITQLDSAIASWATWEIAINLIQAPVWEFGVLLIWQDDDAEEIFYHRRVSNTIYTYAINRTDPKDHSVGERVVMNDSAWLFNYLSKNVYNHFYIYKESLTSVFVFWGKVFKEQLIDIPSKSLTISSGNNFIYIDNNWEIQTTQWQVDWYLVWKVVKSWTVINIEKYNIVWFGKDGLQWPPWPPWLPWVDGKDWTDGKDGKDGKNWDISWDDQKFVNDEQEIEWNVTIDDWNKTITVEDPDGITTVYKEDWIYIYWPDGELVDYIPLNGHYEDGTIVYDDGDVVDWNKEVIDIDGWHLAYRNKQNTFTEPNKFTKLVQFTWWVSFPYNTIDMTWVTTILVDVSKWSKHRAINLSTTDNTTYKLNFKWLTSGSNYMLAVNVPLNGWAPITAKLRPFDFSVWSDYDIDPDENNQIKRISMIGWNQWTLSLQSGTHMFAFDTFTDNIHISYLWSSERRTAT